MRKALARLLAAAALVALVSVSIVAGTSAYYGSEGGAGCGRCLEIRPAVEAWQHSSHRGVSCASCHGSSFSTDLRMHAKSLSRAWRHARGETPEAIHIRNTDVPALVERCATSLNTSSSISKRASPSTISRCQPLRPGDPPSRATSVSRRAWTVRTGWSFTPSAPWICW